MGPFHPAHVPERLDEPHRGHLHLRHRRRRLHSSGEQFHRPRVQGSQADRDPRRRKREFQLERRRAGHAAIQYEPGQSQRVAAGSRGDQQPICDAAATSGPKVLPCGTVAEMAKGIRRICLKVGSREARQGNLPRCLFVMAVVWGSGWPCLGQLPVYGDYYAHDPSRMIKQENTYFVYRTSQGIMSKYSTDLRNWTYGGRVFPGNAPSWTTNAVPGFTLSGSLWAPDIVLLNGTNYLYYSVSTFGSQVSAIGLVTTTNLATGPWTDQGPVIQSTTGDLYNCI